MKSLIYPFFFLLLLRCTTKGNDPNALKTKNNEVLNIQDSIVLVCKGPRSYAYHDHFCQGLKKCSVQIEKMSIDEAKRLDRIPCGYCYNSALSKSDANNASNDVPGQCKARTKKGIRCSRSSRSGEYCWQHRR
jgi:hypothetical protein